MRRFDGSLARTLDFGNTTTTTALSIRSVRGQLRLAIQRNAGPFDTAQGGPFDTAQGRPVDEAQGGPFDTAQGGPDKYKTLEHRRRQAQIKARRLLEV
jgi:hypothetical protein